MGKEASIAQFFDEKSLGLFANKKVKTKKGEECKDRHFQRGNRNPAKILSLIVRLKEALER